MGTDIRSFAQRRDDQGAWIDLDCKPFDWRSYAVFGFLADIRNYSNSPVLHAPRGWPADFHLERPEVDEYGHGRDHRDYHDRYEDYHNKTWFTPAELRAFDYDQTFVNRRDQDHPTLTLREFLHQGFFNEIDRLEALGAERIMVCFD